MTSNQKFTFVLGYASEGEPYGTLIYGFEKYCERKVVYLRFVGTGDAGLFCFAFFYCFFNYFCFCESSTDVSYFDSHFVSGFGFWDKNH